MSSVLVLYLGSKPKDSKPGPLADTDQGGLDVGFEGGGGRNAEATAKERELCDSWMSSLLPAYACVYMSYALHLFSLCGC